MVNRGYAKSKSKVYSSAKVEDYSNRRYGNHFYSGLLIMSGECEQNTPARYNSDPVPSSKRVLSSPLSPPDGLSNRVLRELSKALTVPYCSLFNQSLRVGIVPSS